MKFGNKGGKKILHNKRLLSIVFIHLFFMLSFVSAQSVVYRHNEVLGDMVNNGASVQSEGVTIRTGGVAFNVTAISKHPSTTATRVAIRLNSTGAYVYNGTFVGDRATFTNARLEANTVYFITMNASGAAWDMQYRNAAPSTGYPVVSTPLTPRLFNYTSSKSSGTELLTIFIPPVSIETNNDTLTLNNPPNMNISLGSSLRFNSTIYRFNETIRNMTLYIWRNNGTELITAFNDAINGSRELANSESLITGFDTLSIENYRWNVLGCSSNDSNFHSCAFADSNFSFFYGATINSENFSATTNTGALENFGINITHVTGFPNIEQVTGNLIYDGVSYAGTVTGSGNNPVFSRQIIIPYSGSQTRQFFWQILLFNGTATFNLNTTTQSQTVNTVTIDNCVSNNIRIINYTLFDEDDRNVLTPSASLNTTIEVYTILSDLGGVQVTNYSGNFSNRNPVDICITGNILNSSAYRLDSTAKYSTTNRVVEFHNLQNVTITNNSIPINAHLYDLLITRSQEFLIIFKDANLIPIKDALFDITREYLSIGTFFSVEIPKTDADGKTTAHLVPGDEVYTIYVRKEGRLLATFNNVRAVCANQGIGDCKLNLNAQASTIRPDLFFNRYNLNYLPSYNATSRVYSFNFISLDGSLRNVILNVSVYSPTLNDTICTNSIGASSGTLSCTIPNSVGNGTGIAKITIDGALLLTDTFDIQGSLTNILGYSRFFFAFLLIITLPLIAAASGAVSVMFFIIGLIFAGLLMFLDLGGIIGASSALIWFVVAAGIILWKVYSGRNP